MKKTLLKKLHIRKFRALNDVEIDFGTALTVICGKNGTSKSSILGIAAQIFSFERDYQSGNEIDFQTITGTSFKSLPLEHFRFSSTFDVPGTLDVSVELMDGYTNTEATAELELSRRGRGARPVLRKNSTATASENSSRNFTHPVIFLSLKRLLPIAARDYQTENFDYLNNNKEKFLALTNELLNKTASLATGTAGSINSAVAHGANYDQESVSAGEDNVGQIALALMSFRKLKDEYRDYKGGLLLIDEADAGLFPAAQLKLIDVLERECRELHLQVVMTSHSPTLIEYTFDLSKRYQRKFKTIYLSDTFGSVQAMHDMSWAMISADLHTRTLATTSELALPLINVYFEDQEGCDLFNTLMYRHPCKKYLSLLSEVSLGCSNYIQLATKGVPEFSRRSLICLDADVDQQQIRKLQTIVTLPGDLPPDQLIFQYLYNLPRSHAVWSNPHQFTRAVFTARASQLIGELSISGDTINIGKLVATYRSSEDKKKKLRELFKAFYNNTEVNRFLKQRKPQSNPWHNWAKERPSLKEDFRRTVVERIKTVMRDAFGVDAAKLSILDGV